MGLRQVRSEVVHRGEIGKFGMRIVRLNTFETNSSAVHAMVICTEKDYARWQAGELLLDRPARVLIEFDAVKDTESYLEDLKYPESGREYQSPDGLRQFCEEGYFHEFYEEFDSPSGDAMVAFGYYTSHC